MYIHVYIYKYVKGIFKSRNVNNGALITMTFIKNDINLKHLHEYSLMTCNKKMSHYIHKKGKSFQIITIRFKIKCLL